MLKIYINNEEVIANQNFTIQKHMLNTPSVVLNNVCPKTWCDSKDYITNFYHPLDYSKCKIIDEIYHPADPGITTIIDGSATLNNVDTTKSYELTQITGNTTQSGTPTPDSPQPINVVSGRQDITTCGKNLFDISKVERGISYSYGSTGSVPTSSFSNARACLPLNNVIRVKPNTTYTFNHNSNWRIALGQLTSEKVSLGDTGWKTSSTMPLTITTSATCEYIGFNFSKADNTTITNNEWNTFISSEIQLEKDSTATEYEQYKGQNYEINLGKNLFDKSTAPVLNMFIGSTTINNNASTRLTYIPIQPNTTYTISKVLSSRFYVATTTAIPSNGLAFTTSVSGNSKTELTITSGANDQYLSVFFYHSSYDTLTPEEILDTLQIEKGSQATDYAPYKTPIELCKIGDYQDRIYKENGTWYLHKEIGKVQLTSDSSWSWRMGNALNGSKYYETVHFPEKKVISDNNPRFYCQYLDMALLSRTADLTNVIGMTNASNIVQVRIKNTTSTLSLTDLNNWLNNNTVYIYYVLNTPTTTEITDTELINQLNSIKLLEGLNNISITSPYLTGNYTLHYNYSDAYTTEDLLFCGVVKNSGNISLNPRQPHYSTLQVLDFKTLLSEGETLDFVIYQKTILEAIQQVIATIQAYGFVLGNINILNPNDIIGAYSTKDKTAYDVFNYIADITQSRWTTRLIDENTVAIDFYDPTLMPQGTEIDYTNAYFNDKLIDDMKYSYGTNNYRNKQVMISNQVYSNISQTQTIVANGYQTQFPTEQPIGKINSITSNGIPLTFATFNEKDMGYVADFYYTPGENYFESDDLRSTGEILIIDYVAIVEGRQVITNASEIERINESTGRKGIIARYETRNDATTSTELQKIGESYIKYKGTPEIILTIQSRKNTWEVGQRVQFNAPIDELETEYMVRSKKINYIANQQENESQLFYTYELVSSFNSETEINYFDNQRAKASGNIGEGEYISRNIDIESLAEIIFYETTTTEVVPSGDNELNAILNSPFIS